MKRIGNIYDEIISIENLTIAHKNARKGKLEQKGVIRFDKEVQGNIKALHDTLKACEYKSPKYAIFTIYEPKERQIFVLPYPHRVIQHAILQKIGSMFVKNFTRDTYSCIKKRGIHACKKAIQKAMLDTEATRYTLKMDVKKFYPSVNLEILKTLLLRKIKDKKVIKLLFEIIDGNEQGLPIGSYLSQFLSNFYLSSLDHHIKEQLKVRFYFKYCDDMIIFSDCKKELHYLRVAIEKYLNENLDIQLKGNYQVFPTIVRGLDVLGYRFFGSYILLRKSIKKKYARMLKHNPNQQSIASYDGWLSHANCINLKRTLLLQNEIQISNTGTKRRLPSSNL